MSGDRIRKIDHNPCTHAFTQYSRCEQRERHTETDRTGSENRESVGLEIRATC
jgi:hypothetical protein